MGMPVAQCLLRDDTSNPESDAAPMLQRMWARKLVHHPKLNAFPDEAQADYSGFGVPLEQCAALDHCSYQGQCQVRYGGESAFLKSRLAGVFQHSTPSHSDSAVCKVFPGRAGCVFLCNAAHGVVVLFVQIGASVCSATTATDARADRRRRASTSAAVVESARARFVTVSPAAGASTARCLWPPTTTLRRPTPCEYMCTSFLRG